jgi:hypothetical protein
MKSISYLSFLILIALNLSSCTSPSPPVYTQSPTISNTTSPPPSEVPPVTPSSGPSLPPQSPSSATPISISPTPEPPSKPRTQYNISATLNYGEHHLAVEQLIIYTHISPEPIEDILLIVEPARYPATFTLKELAWLEGSPITDFQRELGLIRIPLENPLEPGATAGISLSYEINIPSPNPSYYGRPVPFGYSSRQTNLVDWYPFIPPYQAGEGWIVHQPGAFGEHLVYEVADFKVHLQITDTRPDLLIAASAPGMLVDNWWQYELDEARNFSLSISDQYVLSTTTVDSVLVMSYYFPINAQAGEAVLQTTAESLGLYNTLFGAYPRTTLSVVEADFLDGMEYDGLYFLSKGFYNLYTDTPGDYLTAIAAHETSHQWWYSEVANDQALEPWLDEALSTYSEKLYYEKVQPSGLDWWWTYRINYYNPQGWVDGSIYNPQGYRAYRDAIYLNGAKFLDDLRKLTGDTAFFDFLKSYVALYAKQITSTDQFFTLLSEFTQADLQPLLDEYFEKR